MRTIFAPQRSIFMKMYLCFLLAIVLGIATQLLLDRLTDSGPFRTRTGHPDAVLLAFYGQTALDSFNGGDGSALQDVAERLRRSAGIVAYIADNQGRELSGRELPPQYGELIRRALASGVPEESHDTGSFLLAVRIGKKGSSQHVVLGEMRPHGFGSPPPRPPHVHPAYRVLIMAAVSGIVCFIFARYLTSPVYALRDATRRFAAGEFTVRVGRRSGGRQDELADLAQDFDRMAERIEALMTTQRQLFCDISHELRTPLTRLKVALELARKKTGPEAEASLNRIEREADEVNELIGQVLSLSRIESGMENIQMTTIDLAELICEIVSDAHFEAQALHRMVVTSVVEQCTIAGNAELLRRAVENVIRNAVNYTREHTTVTVSLTAKAAAVSGNRQAVITVQDHGPGVPPAELENLFRPFYRVSDARDRETGGVGLGLAIAERAVHLHHGYVHAANVEGGGLLVTMVLPIA